MKSVEEKLDFFIFYGKFLKICSKKRRKVLKHILQLYCFLTNFQKALKMPQNGKKCDFANYILRIFSHF